MMDVKLFLSFVLLQLCFCFGSQIKKDLIIHLNNGYKYRGFTGDNVTVFLGIPFAKPPIGELRFRKPEPLLVANKLESAAVDVKDANQWPPICPQGNHLNHLTASNEDCLYLNIWIPKKGESEASNNDLKAVMVFIHGGAYLYGSSSYHFYNGSQLATVGNVIVVTFNYRLGALGFLYSGTSEAPGNPGLHDMVMALKWVKENIAQFGGDSNRITVFGESAGGSAISYLLSSPLTKSLIHRAIPMSGVGLEFSDGNPENPISAAKKFAEILDCGTNLTENQAISKESIACLRRLPVKEILSGQYNAKVIQATGSLTGRAFSPVIDGQLLPEAPGKMWSAGKFEKNVPLLIGDVLNEGFTVDPTKSGSTMTTKAEFINLASSLLRTILLKKCPIRIPDVIQFYFDGIDETDHKRAHYAFQDMLTDAYFDCDMNRFAERYSKVNTVYQYLYTFYSKPYVFGCKEYGPCHGNDLAMTFGTHDGGPEEQVASREWIQILTGFAKTGKVNWEPYLTMNTGLIVPKYLVFNGTFSKTNVRVAYKEFECNFWTRLCPLS